MSVRQRARKLGVPMYYIVSDIEQTAHKGEMYGHVFEGCSTFEESVRILDELLRENKNDRE